MRAAHDRASGGRRCVLHALRGVVFFIVLGIATTMSATITIHFYDGTHGPSFGAGIASIGDLNGDGVPEFVVGAPNVSPPDPSGSGTVMLAGEVYVFDGLTGQEKMRIGGDVPQRYLGAFAAPAGDFDGDDVPDILLGAPGDANMTRGPGHVVVISGADGSELFRATGTVNTNLFGASADILPDVTGDGVPEVVVGTVPWTGPGIVRVYSGADGSVIDRYTWRGSSGNSQLGKVAVLGDVNGDGVSDFAMGAPGDEDLNGTPFMGTVTLVSGLDGTEIHQFRGRVRKVGGQKVGEALGSSVAALGDMNGDGVPDFIAGSVGVGGGTGGATVFSGAGDVLAVIKGVKEYELAGMYVASAGDLNGDGVAEFIVSGTEVVRVFALGSKKSAVELARFEGTGVGDVGRAAGGGDLDSDGHPDILFASGGKGRAWALGFPDLQFGPVVFPKLKLRAPFIRSGDGTAGKGKLSFVTKKSKLKMQVALASLPADETYTVHLETGPGAGEFKLLGTLPATRGKGKFTLGSTGSIPENLGVRNVDELGGRRIEIRDGAGATILSALLPYSGGTTSVKVTEVLDLATGSPFPDATGTLKGKFSGKSGASKLDLRVGGVPKDTPLTLWSETAPGSGEFEEAGEIVNGRLKRSTSKGEQLPGHVPILTELMRKRLVVRSKLQDVLTWTPQTASLPRPDYRPTDIDVSLFGSYLTVKTDVRNRGTGAGGPVNIMVTVSYSDDPADKLTETLRTSVSFPAGSSESDLYFSPMILPVSGTPELRVRIDVDPKPSDSSWGEYMEENEENNDRCAVFTWKDGEYEMTSESPSCD